jgi:hypothetical protein
MHISVHNRHNKEKALRGRREQRIVKERSANYEQEEHITTHLKESLGRIEEAALVYMGELTDKTCED